MKHLTSLLLTMALSSSTIIANSIAPMDQQRAIESKSQLMGFLSSERTVISEKQMAPGIKKRAVRDSRGRIFYDIVKNGKVSAAPQYINRPWKAVENASFFENFEGHTNELDWLPEGWTEINTPENTPTLEMCSHNINNSWNVQDTGDGYWTDITTDGVKECWIHFTYNWSYQNGNGEKIEGAAAPQDEWVITPQFTVGQNHDLFFLAEIDRGAIYDFSWNSMAYDRNIVECDLEVHVSTDNGTNWTCIWKASSDVCAAMTDDEMYDMMGELKYSSYCVPLTQYYGQNVKIAFRYLNSANGMSGNSMAVDAVTVAAPAPEAFYYLPEGILMAGISDGLHSNSESYILLPANTPIEWKASSNAYTENNSWAFFNESTGEMDNILTGNEAVVTYSWSEGQPIPYPVLTATNPNGSDTYSPDINDSAKGGMYVGGNVPDLADEKVYLGNYDYIHKHLVTPNFGNGSYCFGTAAANTWGTNIEQVAFGNLFMAPPAPLTVYDIMLTLGEFDADEDAEIKLEIYTVDNYGQVSAEPVATAVALGKDIDGWGFYNAFFHLDTPYEMTEHTLMMISGFADSSKVRTFAACAQSVHNDANHNYAYMMFRMPDNSLSLYPASAALEDYSSALYISLNGAFHFLKLEEEIVELDPESNMIEVKATATNDPEKWWIVDNDNRLPLVAEGTVHDWLTVTPVTKEDGSYAVRFSAEDTDKQRSKTVYLSNGGSQSRIRVRQQATVGIDNVTYGDFSISITGNTLTVNGVDENAVVKIYRTDGRLVYSGANNVSTENLIKGIYIVNCGSHTAKFTK